MMPNHKPKEVCCLALNTFFDYLDIKGVPRKELQQGLPYPAEYLEHRLNWIDYKTFLLIEARMQALFPNEPDLFFRLGQAIRDVPSLGFLRILVRAVTSPFQMYRQLPRLVPRFLFPFVEIKLHKTSDNSLVATYTFRAEYAPTEAFLQTVRGILTSLPQLVGGPPAKVELAHDSQLTKIFSITLEPQWLGPIHAIKKFFRKLINLFHLGWRDWEDFLKELENANHLLQEKVEALTDAKTELDRKVKELSVLNQLHREATSELELRSTLKRVVSLLSEELSSPIAILLAEGEPISLILASQHNFPRLPLMALEELSDPTSQKTQRLASGEYLKLEFPNAEQQWMAIPLEHRQKTIGALVFHTEEESDISLSLLESLSSELAVAIDNAISYELITELRDTLELRVSERTNELEEARTRLEQTVIKLEQADQSQRDFFTNVSHELKTPLTLIVAPLDQVAKALPKEDQNARESLKLVRENTHSLLALINEILDFAHLESGELEFVWSDFNLGRLTDDLIISLRPLADRKQLKLNYYPPSGKTVIHGDGKMIKRVITNLLVNAIKYVDVGDSIDVRIFFEGASLILEVKDSGPGIPEEDLPRIFDRFHRARDRKGRVIGGSGIGLAMAKEIVDLHDGEICVESRLDEGTTFQVMLPISTQTTAQVFDFPRPAVPQSEEIQSDEWLDEIHGLPGFQDTELTSEYGKHLSRGHRHHILLVEDNPKMRRFLARLLNEHYNVSTAADGREALAIANTELPELILSDVMMPHLSGTELCKIVKSDPRMRMTPVILISARHGTEAALEAFEANADDFVIKPFSPAELLARINAQLKIRSLTLTLLRMEKQTTLGLMAAGLAHEIYNPINAILTATIPLRSAFPPPPQLEEQPQEENLELELVKIIELSGQRIRKVVDAVLSMARQDKSDHQLQFSEVSKEIDSVLSILSYRIDHSINIHTEYSVDELICYPKLLAQVVMNLVVNALDALQESGSNIWIKARKMNDQFELSVENDGPPIPPHERERIFMPFYTTKDPGQGTGLGLAISREVASLHDGQLELATHRKNTCFVLTFPLLQVADST